MASVTCPQCGTVNPPGARFCRGCGLNLTQKLRQSGALHPLSPTPGATPPPSSGAPTMVQGGGQPGVPPQGVVAQALGGEIGITPLAPGVTLQHGRYVVERPLGKGGMGSVFLAHDTHVNNKPVVIKEMANIYATEQERREAEAEFQAEMETLANLSHPNIPQITDYFTESNRHFAVQEYVAGQDLQKALEAIQVPNSPPRGLPEKQVLAWVSQVLSVLEYLEAQNPQVIHRDIKPANIVVDANNRVRVVDFGIASHKFKPGSTRAMGQQVSTALGTPGYAPKEQFTGQETPLSDLYALGATMHQLLTGRDPTKVQPLWEYPPVRALNPKISPATERIVMRAVQNDPKKRYQNATAMKRDVDRVLNPPGALSTFKGKAIATLVLLFLLGCTALGVYIYAQIQNQQRPVDLISDGGTVAFDTDTTGLSALGVSPADAQKWIALKIQASKDMAHGNTQAALNEYKSAVSINQADAESQIYLEDHAVLDTDPHPYKIAVGGSFGPSPNGGADNVTVGRQNLQGAYTAQKYLNDQGGIGGHLVYLVLANDQSTKAGATQAAQKLAARDDILAVIGFAFSSRTQAILPALASKGIPVITPSASSPSLNALGAGYFFRICPSDRQQGKAGIDYLLGTLLGGKSAPTIGVVGAPADPYAGGLQTVAQDEARQRGAKVVIEDYTMGQSDFSVIAQDLQAQHVDAVYFAGYAREALLLSKAMDDAGIPQSVPIMSDDGFYDPASFVTYGSIPKGRFHFTSFFFPDEWGLVTGQDRQNIQNMEAHYTTYFHKPGTPFGGYGTSRVSADTALTADAVRTVLFAIKQLGSAGQGVSRQSIKQALSGMGTAYQPYDGVTGHIRYAPATDAATLGDPINKAIVVLHLDAKQGRTHVDRLLGQY